MAGHNLNQSFDQYVRNQGFSTVRDAVENVILPTIGGDFQRAMGQNFYGINHRMQPQLIPINRDTQGLTFFTRPNLNLVADNLRVIREFAPLLTKNADSLPRIVRCTLDPLLAKSKDNITTQFVDPDQAFIPCFSNQLLSMSGWPDLEAPTFSAPEGIYKESFSIVDGVVRVFSTYDITANFHNIQGSPIIAMLLPWLYYMAEVYLGNCVPYLSNLVNNRIDYMTRIYYFTTDASRSYVESVTACGAGFPLTVPVGARSNFDSQTPLNQANAQFTVNFRCIGAMYNDEILLDEFNQTVERFNPGMEDRNRDSYFVKIPFALLQTFNMKGCYPRIDLDTKEIQWWVRKSDYTAVVNLAKRRI